MSCDWEVRRNLVWTGHYKKNIRNHYILTALMLCQNSNFPLSAPLPGCFNLQPILLAPPRNTNSCDTSHKNIYNSVVVRQTATRPNPFKVRAVPLHNSGCDTLFHWIQVSHNHHQFPKLQKYQKSPPTSTCKVSSTRQLCINLCLQMSMHPLTAEFSTS
jgi:hypothetical protein